jgi:hypothetical protein
LSQKDERTNDENGCAGERVPFHLNRSLMFDVLLLLSISENFNNRNVETLTGVCCSFIKPQNRQFIADEAIAVRFTSAFLNAILA